MMGKRMLGLARALAPCLLVAFTVAPALAAAAGALHGPRPKDVQETGFLNRTVEIHGTLYHFQVYLPEDFRRDDRRQWPIILFLHGRGERGAEGMWQTEIGLPSAIRDHPERWPFIVVMPQCLQMHYWTDSDMLTMAMAALDQETIEFHADTARTYLTGLSLGGYGAWELARDYPRRWAAIAIAAGGVFWSYAPERWHEAATLPAEYAHAVGRTPIWVFHGSDDPVVPLREDELMFAALKVSGGHIRYWVYQGLHHDCWFRAFNEPDLPRWLLSHRIDPKQEPAVFSERVVIPLHPPALRLTPTQLDSFTGDYVDEHGALAVTLFRQADQLYQKNIHGEINELAAESLASLFYPNGSSLSHVAVERDLQGRITSLVFRDDRHEERWERQRTPSPSR
ncbi:MAG TPA: alpha/beta hydrolase-fold protein [Terracidiphilus sp.]|jgi:poly(3-hydroxybutyrate) depolymerase|nr:alpha/beta hydrolase-fold protein [Terracidiphilus sp.]